MTLPKCCGEVLQNTANGQSFFVCRGCKKEVGMLSDKLIMTMSTARVNITEDTDIGPLPQISSPRPYLFIFRVGDIVQYAGQDTTLARLLLLNGAVINVDPIRRKLRVRYDHSYGFPPVIIPMCDTVMIKQGSWQPTPTIAATPGPNLPPDSSLTKRSNLP